MPVSNDAAAIAAAILTNAHAASVVSSNIASEERIKQIAWLYRNYLQIAENHGFTHEDAPPPA